MEFIRDSLGLIIAFSYYTSTTATSTHARGRGRLLYIDEHPPRRGRHGASCNRRKTTFRRTAGGTTIYLPANNTVYTDTNGTGGLTTSYAYTFFSGTVQVESQTTTDPAGGVVTVVNDSHGRPAWKKDAEGFIHYAAYDQTTGAIVTTITDVDTGDVTGEPSGWTTPSGGGLHLVTTVRGRWPGPADEGDRRQRQHQLHRLRRRGPRSPRLSRLEHIHEHHDRPHDRRPRGPRRTTTPRRSRCRPRPASPAAGRRVPSRSAACSRSRGRFNNDAGQAGADRRVLQPLAGLTYSTSTSLGTLNTHFYRTTMAYDSRGRLAKVVRADGTIYRTVFDGQGRPLSRVDRRRRHAHEWFLVAD